MRIELTRTFPVALKEGFDYLHDFKTWPAWYVGMLDIIDPEMGAWNEKGDKVRFAYRLLGRRIEGEAVLETMDLYEFAKFTSTVEGLPPLTQEWHYSELGEMSFALKVVLEVEEPTSFFGKVIDKMVLPRVLERDLRMTLDNLEEIFKMGVPV